MINIFQRKKDFLSFRKTIKNKTIGLVPTMGNLHQGHLSLLKMSLKENDLTIMTIFINPKQFGPNEDFENYPRTLDQDLALISSIKREYSSKEVIVFAPENPLEIYSDDFATSISVESYLTNILCAKSRPDHFKGVTTIIYKLFKICHAQNAYFGQKDFQQFKIIEKMVLDLEIDIKLNMMPIIREASGLALSSRNKNLKSDQKELSLRLRSIILETKKLILENSLSKAIEFCNNTLKLENFEYLEILDSKNLEVVNKKTQSIIILGALKVGETRLIDNQMVEVNA